MYRCKATVFSMLLFFVALSISATSQTASAEGEFSLQGRLTDANGEAVVDGQHTLDITIYDESGTDVYSETDLVTTVDGVFSTTVGDDNTLMMETDGEYEVGISVNGGTELSPRIMINDAPRAITSKNALNAEAVGGFSVSTSGNPEPNTLVTLDANGEIAASLLANSTVTSFNGMQGDVELEVTGSGVSLEEVDGKLQLSISGSGGGDFELPFTGSANVGLGEEVFEITAVGEGAAALFNADEGAALMLTADNSASAALDISNTGGAAINAAGAAGEGAVLHIQNTSGSVDGKLMTALDASGETAFEIASNGQTMINSTEGVALDITTDATADAAVQIQNMNADATARLITALDASGSTAFDVAGSGQTMINATGGTALDVTTDAAAMAALKLQNTADGSSGMLIEALNANGEAALTVMANGKTTINSTAADALEVSTEAAGETALKVTGGLMLDGAAGTGTIEMGEISAVVDNALVDANSIIILTVNSATNLGTSLRIAGQQDGSFTVSLLDDTIGALAGDVSFNYLIISQ